MENGTDIKSLLQSASNAIPSDSPQLDAEILLAHVLGKPRSYLFAWPEKQLPPDAVSAFRSLIERRIAGEPVAYLTGRRDFWSLTLTVSPDVLIPRPDTELLVELALQRPPHPAIDVLDMGTGSGAIALALASERPAWRLTATDYSRAALTIARDNAARHHLSNVHFLHGSWYDATPTQHFHLIISNPPYIRNDDPHLQQDDLRFEPEEALASGRSGLDDIEQIAAGAPGHLHPNGLLLVEHGYDQANEVRQIFRHHGLVDVTTRADLEGRERVTLGRKIRA
jgi:release factor glutamine methyltransferase